MMETLFLNDLKHNFDISLLTCLVTYCLTYLPILIYVWEADINHTFLGHLAVIGMLTLGEFNLSGYQSVSVSQFKAVLIYFWPHSFDITS